jgi:hypothetical protein
MITRRNFIKTSALGAGAIALSPSLSALGSNSKSKRPHRFIFIRKSNGNLPEQFSLPSFSTAEKKKDQDKIAFVADLDKHELPTWLRALDPYKENMSILHGISCEVSGSGHGSKSGSLGSYKDRGGLSDVKRATIDYELAYLNPSPFTHVELALRGNYKTFNTGIITGMSAPQAHQRNYCYCDPETANNELFKSVLSPTVTKSENLRLTYLIEKEQGKLKALKGEQRTKVESYIQSMQSVIARNNKVVNNSSLIKKYLPTLNKVHKNGGPNANTLEKQDGMTDVLVAAFASGLTNVVTYTIDLLATPQIGIPGNEGDQVSIHAIGHNEVYSGTAAKDIRNKIKTCHMSQVKTIVEKLKAVPEGKGTMFDNTTIIYMPDTGAGHHQPSTEMPMVIMTGKNSKLDLAGRFIRLPFHLREGHKTLGNWYTTILNAYGNPIKHYGDLDLKMSSNKMDQLGPIKQFMV